MAQKPTYEDLEQKIKTLEKEVDEHRKIKTALLDRDKRSTAAKRMAHIGDWVWDVKTGKMTWSEEVYHIFGLDQKNFRPDIDSAMERFHPEDQKLHQEVMAQAIANRRQYTFEAQILRPDGSDRFLLLISEGHFDHQEALTHISGIVQDITKRKQAEETLRQSESFLDSVIEQSPYPVWISDNKGLLIKINPACCKLLNLTSEEIIGKYNVLEDNIVEEHGFMPLVRSVFEEGETVRFNLKYDSSQLKHLELKKTAFVILDVIIFPIKDRKGNVTNAVIQHIDITAKMQAEEALRDSEEKYRLLIKNLPSVVFRGFKDWSVQFIDNKAELLTGYCIDEFNSRRMKWSDVVVKEDAKKSRDIFIDALKTDKSYVREYRIRPKSGNVRWIQERGYIVCDQKGEIEHISGVFFDVTDRRQAEEKQVRLATAVTQAAELVIITDSDGTIEYVNPAFETATGYTAEQVIGENPRILKSGLQNDAFYKDMWETITTGKVWKGRITNKKKDGSLYQEEATISPIRNNDNKIINYVGVKRDITKEVQLENRFRQAQKMEAIGTLAGGIAHDFNNILSAIVGYTEIALMDAAKDSELQTSLYQVLKAGKRAKDLVTQILAFSRQSEIEPKPVKVASIATEALKLLRASLPATIEIRQNLQSNSAVMADPTQIHQILMNLCTNAGQAMQKKGGILDVLLTEVSLDAEFAAQYPEMAPGTFLKLSIGDTGHGMAPEIQERIFDPFFTTKGKSEGTGMGLSVVHGIIQEYGGAISVYSESGKGSTFNVFLPVIKSKDVLEVKLEEPMLYGTERILFIDDEEFQVDLGKQMLERMGYSVMVKTSSLSALEQFRNNPHNFDLVITDFTMPKMTGAALGKAFISIRNDIPMILLTGYSEGITEKNVKSMGFKGFAMKPIIMKELAKIIRKVLDQR